MAGIFERPREGTRGGRDQFKWDDVKLDKHRENYLGHSLQVCAAYCHSVGPHDHDMLLLMLRLASQ